MFSLIICIFYHSVQSFSPKTNAYYKLRRVLSIMSTNIQLLSAIRPSDIPAEYADLVEVLGLDGFLTLVDLCGGQSLYIPKGETLRRDGRDREIRARFNGGNYRALASQFRLSERQIRKIVNGTRV